MEEAGAANKGSCLSLTWFRAEGFVREQLPFAAFVLVPRSADSQRVQSKPQIETWSHPWGERAEVMSVCSHLRPLFWVISGSKSPLFLPPEHF